jgi:hypothetical protein
MRTATFCHEKKKKKKKTKQKTKKKLKKTKKNQKLKNLQVLFLYSSAILRTVHLCQAWGRMWATSKRHGCSVAAPAASHYFMGEVTEREWSVPSGD